jgi:hypothetical protein
VLFLDPVVVTGSESSDDLAARAAIGFFLFVPAGENERLLEAAGLTVLAVEDTTESMAAIAQRRAQARALHAVALRETEGDEAFDGQQRFFETAPRLARERRLSRIAYVAERR